jgi:hypothetical protein
MHIKCNYQYMGTIILQDLIICVTHFLMIWGQYTTCKRSLGGGGLHYTILQSLDRSVHLDKTLFLYCRY